MMPLGLPLITAIFIATLLAAGLIAITLAERRRRGLQGRLGGVSAASRRGEATAATGSLRLAQPKETMRGRALPKVWRERLDLAYAATGNRVGPLHTLGVGLAAGGAAFGLTSIILQLPFVVAVIASGCIAVVGMIALLQLARGRFQRKFLDVFPDALDLIVRAVKAGLPVLDAMGIVSREVPDPVGGEFRRILEEMRVGFDPAIALQRSADRIRVPDFQFYVVSLSLQRRTGGGLAETLSNLSGVIRRRKDLRVKSRALSAEAKASAVVLSLLPVVAFIGLFMMDSKLMSVLIFDPRGRFMFGVAITSQILGILTIAGMIRRMMR
ncbi:MAG TPA: type II secretion system F family protein [Stellaceae bacterium]|nr:type II secretion system F family protein [Stellaceae bacterium]